MTGVEWFNAGTIVVVILAAVGLIRLQVGEWRAYSDGRVGRRPDQVAAGENPTRTGRRTLAKVTSTSEAGLKNEAPVRAYSCQHTFAARRAATVERSARSPQEATPTLALGDRASSKGRR